MSAIEIPTVTATTLPAGARLIDVREPDEWAAGHAPGAAHLPMMQIPDRAAEVPRDGDVVVVCRSGARSAQVVSYLLANGWGNVHNLDGGMRGWAAAGQPMVADDDRQAQVI
ncbi:rhodanese-like domain-containing protein [Pilimelia columellifera]|uniref:Rhodanese-like domain-containing protein n=1 Tax=Pilimelia columellifera subsp. columellifera TaxID=706583 RepID=A0ABP6ALI4_9ACTN